MIRQIVERDLRQHGLDKKTVRREAAELYAAACEHFGTWDTALHYAGINWRRVTKTKGYTPDRALSRLRCLCLRGYDLSSQRNKVRDRPLWDAIRKYFGTWEQGLYAVGLNLEHAHASTSIPRLNKDQILAAVHERRQAGLSLNWSQVCLENRDLAMAAKGVFGSWPRVIAAAGLEPDQPRIFGRVRWNEARIIAAIQRRSREGKSVNRKVVCQDDSALLAAAQRYFGSWQNAVNAAGIVAQ